MTTTPSSLSKGDVVDGLRVMSELGRGAESIIYLVQDQKTKQIWALKHVEKREPKHQRFLDQAEMEYKIAQNFDHPALRKIPRLIKKKERLVSVKELYLVMEMVDGTSLDNHPPKTFEEAVHIFRQVARGLEHMHQKGYVHADMKPNNIVVSDDGEAKVIDLGQSCKIGTVKERIQGTPDYIAPEQVHRREITPLTDVYNFGATMYWVLTRKHIPTALPKGDSLLGSIDDNLLEKPKRAIELNPRINERLDQLIMKCVEVNPDDRPASMGKVADSLDLILGILLAEASNARSRADMPAQES